MTEFLKQAASSSSNLNPSSEPSPYPPAIITSASLMSILEPSSRSIFAIFTLKSSCLIWTETFLISTVEASLETFSGSWKTPGRIVAICGSFHGPKIRALSDSPKLGLLA